jgi:prolyl-tRNA synthetase
MYSYTKNLFLNNPKQRNSIEEGIYTYRNSSGFHTWMPFGLKIRRKIERLIKNYMNQIGEEISMPSLFPSKFLKDSKRYSIYGKTLFTLENRKGQEFYLAPTHEEPITFLLRSYLNTYKQLPICLYQITEKYRDELRVKGGLLRGKEFIMKDGYSFHNNSDSLEETYNRVSQAYSDFFNQLAIPFFKVEASPGDMQGIKSEEFHIIHPEGEDTIYVSEFGYQANQEVCYLGIKKTSSISIHFFTNEKDCIGIIIADCLSIDKNKFDLQFTNYVPSNQSLEKFTCYVEKSTQGTDQFSTSPWLDAQVIYIASVKNGDRGPDGGRLKELKTLELGHIFQLGQFYSQSLDLSYLDEKDQIHYPLMGCYGIGISRLFHVLLHHYRDNDYLNWPSFLIPFHIIIIPIECHNMECEKLAQQIPDSWEVLIENRKNITVTDILRESKMIGCQYQIIINGKNNRYEIRFKDLFLTFFSQEEIVSYINSLVLS